MKLILLVAVAFLATACGDLVPKAYQNAPYDIRVDLPTYKVDVLKNGKLVHSYPISYGGSDLHPTCQKYPHKNSCERYKMDAPPSGTYGVKESHDSYLNARNKKVKHVILFSRSYNDIRYVMRANKKDASKIGKPLYTGGNIVMRKSDIKELRKLIKKEGLSNFKVDIVR